MIWIYIALVLLLNLVIAQMSDLYDTLKKKASLEYNLNFARRMLRNELFATAFPFIRSYFRTALRVGTYDSGRYYYTFVEVGRNAEGRRVDDKGDIFADLSDSDDE